jgi:hypothetical protein
MNVPLEVVVVHLQYWRQGDTLRTLSETGSRPLQT